jgi:glutathione S-transferase
MESHDLKIIGAVGSPYSRKLRAILRYRRIPHVWINQGSPESAGLPAPRVALLPTVVMEGADGQLQAKVDSTPLVREFEVAYRGRSVVPTDAATAFLDALLEDYADEWLTKAMFHYRWAYQPDIAKAAAILPRWFATNQPEEQALRAGHAFSSRQIERLWVVGSNETTTPVIEDSYRRLLALLDERLTESRFLFGERPAVSDFAMYGQLTQLVGFDPTPSALALEVAPRVAAWVDVVDDLSGVEPAETWSSAESLPASLRALFTEVGRVYVPFLLANARALESGAERVECEIDGRRWEQRPFPYQGRCLAALRDNYAALGADARACVDRALAGTGCERLLDV